MSKRKTHDQFIKELRIINPTVDVLEQYHNAVTKIKVKCLVCGNEWSCTPNSLLSGTGCPECGKKKTSDALRKKHQDFIKELSLSNSSIDVLAQYKSNREKIMVCCKKCGNIWEAFPYDLLLGHGCPVCGYEKQKKAQRHTHEEFIKQLYAVNKDIEVLDNYINNHTRIRFRCKNCGKEWKTVPNSVLLGHGCPKCARSSTSFLEQVIFESFNSVLGDGSAVSRDKKIIGMELDIVVPSLRIALEPGSWAWHYNKIQRDSDKRNLCKDKGYRLITIYTDFQGDTPPFSYDCFIYPTNLGNANWEDTKSFVKSILDAFGLVVADEKWAFIRELAIDNSRRITNDEYINALHKANPTIEVLNEYRDSTTKVNYKCLVCGNKWYALPGSVLLGHGCPACGRRRSIEANRKTKEKFVDEMHIINPKVKIIGDYINNKTKIQCECVDCHNKWEMLPQNLLRGQGCPACGRLSAANKNRKSHDMFIKELHIKNPLILVKGKYIDSSAKIEVECKKCNYTWYADPMSLLSGHGCPRCAKSIKKTNLQFVGELKRLFPTIEPLQEYKSANSKIEVRCQVCGYTWMVRPHDLLRSKGCPDCRKAKSNNSDVHFSI